MTKIKYYDITWLAVEVMELQKLLHEAIHWVTDKPWDDTTLLHSRISKRLGLPIKYQEYIDKMDEET